MNDDDRAAICQRIGSVTSASVARWGRMDAQAMLTHLRQSALMALGELPVANKSKRAFQVFPIKHLILHVVPFPKGAPTAPELLVPDLAPVDAIRAELLTLVERIGEGPREGYGPVHPLFGRLSFREWGVATHKHTDHHLRQFGA
ncbi:MAG: DinB family protein [Pyrinomonadaceae bacterium]|nr:DinB family protein [Pyrinomonadaceae bacterium]